MTDATPTTWTITANGMPLLAIRAAVGIVGEVTLISMGKGQRLTGPARPPVNYAARVTDKTIVAYRDASEEIDRYIAQEGELRSIVTLWRAVDHLETCIDSLHRVADLVEKLRGMKAAPPIDKARLPSRDDQHRLRQMRVAIQHSHEAVLDADPDVVASGFMHPTDDAIVLAGESITYAELAAWIVQYHDVVRGLAAA